MLKLKDAQHELGQVVDRQRAILEASTDGAIPADKKAEYDSLEARAVQIEQSMESIRNFEARQAAMAQIVIPQQVSGTPAEQREAKHLNAFKQYLAGGHEAMSRMSDEEKGLLMLNRATTPMSGANPGTGTTGGILIPTTLHDQVEKVLKMFGGVLSVASVFETASANPLDYPVSDDTANEGEIVGENGSISGGTTPEFSNVRFTGYMYSSKTILIPFSLIQDSQFDLVAMISEMIGERVARITNRHFTVGDNSSKPQGVVVGGTAFTTGVAASTLTGDNTIDLLHSVDPAYAANMATCKYMLNNTSLGALRKLKDSQGRYIWQMGDIQKGVPNTLNGYGYIINQHMANIGASAKSMVFGDFSKYKVRKIGTPRLKRLNELYAENDQIGLVYFDQYDGKVLVPKALSVLTHPAS